MNDFLFEWFGIIMIVWLAVASPGPDFVVSVRNSVLHSQRAGLFTALGISLGICIHVAYCMLGIAALINQSVWLFNLIKYAGAAYLIYIGFKALMSKGYDNTPIVGDQTADKKNLSNTKALGSGFLTNLLNPKATMFFFALFTQLIDPETPLFIQSIYGLSASVTAGLWFSGVAVVLNRQRIRHSFLKFSKWIDRICGACLIGLGVRLAIAKTQ